MLNKLIKTVFALFCMDICDQVGMDVFMVGCKNGLQIRKKWNAMLINRDLTSVYINDNWFVILLSCVYFGDWATEIRHFSLLKTNNRKPTHNTLSLKL